MRKLLLLLFMLFLGLTTKAEVLLVVWKKDGSKYAFALTEKPKVTFSESSVMINSKSISVSYNLEDMAKFTYEEGDNTIIRNLENDKVSSFKFDGELLIFPSLEFGSTVSIHTLNGSVVFSRFIDVAGDYSFPLLHLDKGVYLVSINGVTYKIVKK